MDTAFLWWRGFQERFLKFIAAALFLGPTGLAIVEVVRRYVFNQSFYWQGDAVVWFMVASIYLFFGIAQRRGAHLKVTVIHTVLHRQGTAGQTASRILNVLTSLFSLAFIIFFVYWGVAAVRITRNLGRTTDTQILPIWPFFTILIIGFAFMGISLVFQLYQEVQLLRGKEVTTERPEEEGPIL